MKQSSVLISAIIALGLFVAASYLVRSYEESIVAWVRAGGAFSVAAYLFFAVLSEVVPPVTSLFLIPVGTAAWGIAVTGALNAIGWGIGSVVAFLLARHFGERLRLRFPKALDVPHIETLVSKRHPVLSLVFLRLTFPVDVLSYALGFFTAVPMRLFVVSLVGILPFAFLFPYLSRFPGEPAILAGGVAIVGFLTYAYIRLRYFGGAKEVDSKRG